MISIPKFLTAMLYGIAFAVSLWTAAFAFYGLRKQRGRPFAYLAIAVAVWNAAEGMIMLLSGEGLAFMGGGVIAAPEFNAAVNETAKIFGPGSPFIPGGTGAAWAAIDMRRIVGNFTHLAYSLIVPLVYVFARDRGLGDLRKNWGLAVFGAPIAANISLWFIPVSDGINRSIVDYILIVEFFVGAVVAVMATVSLVRRARDHGDQERSTIGRFLVGAFAFTVVFGLSRVGVFGLNSVDPSPIVLSLAMVFVATGYGRLDPFTAIAENEQRLKRFEFMVDASKEYMSIINKDWRYEAVNEAFCRSNNRIRDEVIGKTVADIWGAERVETWIGPTLMDCFNGRSRVYRDKFSFGNEQEKHLEVSYNPYTPSGSAKPTHVVVVTKDITDYVAKEAELEEARHRADEANKAKSDFLASMSHEIRTPINVMMGLTDLSLRRPLDPELRDDLQTIKAASENLLAIVNDVLDLARIESGRVRLEQVVFSPDSAVERVVKAFKPSSKAKNLSLELTVDRRTPTSVLGDPLRFGQILYNLIGNAIKFTDKGGIYVWLSPAPKRGDKAAAGLLVEVRDTGIGIPADKLDAIFESFTQADAGTSRHYGGSGLGLTISRNLARLLGGDITVESVVGSGSSFTVTVYLEPQAAETAETGPTEGNTAAPLNASLYTASKDDLIDGPIALDRIDDRRTGSADAETATILLAEDNDINARVANRFLKSLGWQADHARNGAEALERLKKRHYSLVLMDVEMPDMDGLEATRRIRAGEAGENARGITIIAMTAYAAGEARDRCAAAGMDDFVTKPLRFAELEAILPKTFTAPVAVNPANAEIVMGNGIGPAAFLPLLDHKNTLMRLADDAELAEELYGIFRDEAAERMAALRLFQIDGNIEALRKVAHLIKGCALSIGAACLAEAASTLERATRGDLPRAGNDHALQRIIDETLDVYAATLAASLNDELRAAATKPRQDRSIGEDRSFLDEGESE